MTRCCVSQGRLAWKITCCSFPGPSEKTAGITDTKSSYALTFTVSDTLPVFLTTPA